MAITSTNTGNASGVEQRTGDTQWPQDARQRSFEETLDLIAKVVGQEHLVTNPEGVELRAKDMMPYVRMPTAYVYPSCTSEVQQIVHIANDSKFPLWPCSKGKNWGYGAATPARDGAIVVNLERMNRILEVNQELAYAVLEPGVTYRQLYDHLTRNSYPLWLDATDGPPDGSVMGNALERGVGETPYGDHFENICGMEVVLPSGELVRTGGGSIHNYRSWNTHKWGVGPYLEGLFSQSNFGIVTQIGMWLMPQPECYLSCVFELRRAEDFPDLIDAIRTLQFHGALRSKIHLINDVTVFGLISSNPRALLQGEGYSTETLKAHLRKRFMIAPWTFGAGLYGTRAQVRADRALVVRELRRLGKLRFMTDRSAAVVERYVNWIRPAMANDRTQAFAAWLTRAIFRKPFECVEALPHTHKIEKGIPSDYFVKHSYMKAQRAKPKDDDIDPARDDCGGIWKGVMVPLEGTEVRGVVQLCESLAERHRIDLNLALIVASPRSVIVLTSIFFDRRSHDECEKARDLYFAIGEETQARGYQPYRTSTIYMDHVLRPAPEFRRLACALKNALDPNWIIAPGKYGIG
jgi:4-cresol dehydrogenase (hydroxylating)